MKKKRKRPGLRSGARAPAQAVRDRDQHGPAGKPAWRQYLLVYLLLAGVTLGVYGQVHRFDFLNYDDDKYVTNNPHVQGGLTLENIAWAITTGYFVNWHPLTWVSYLVDYEIFGLNPGGYHLVNVLFHVLNAFLLFAALRMMTRSLWPSAFVALLFALHPLHVESVAWIAERKDVLSTFFALLTLISYRWYALRPGLRRYGLVLVLFALGLMAKPMLVTLPCVLLLLDYWPLGRLAAPGLDPRVPGVVWWRAVLEKVPLLVLSAISSGITLYVQSQGTVATSALSDGVRVLNAPVAYVHYIGKMFWPFRLAICYPDPDVLPWWQPLGAFGLLVAVSVAVLWLRRRYLVVGWFWYLGTLVPVIGIVQFGAQAMADRYTYVPLIGLFIAGAWGAADLVSAWRVPKAAVAVASAALIAVLATLTAIEVGYWRDSQTLYTRALDVTGANPVAHNNLGLILADLGRKDEAVAHYQRAAEELDTIRNNPVAHNNLASALDQLGRTDEAIAQYRKALEIDPNCAQAHNNLGAIFAKRGDLSEAISHYEEAVRINPQYVSAHYNLATALARTGRHQSAVEHFRQAIHLDPGNVKTHYNLAVALTSMGKLDEAVTEYLEVVKLAPDNVDAYINLGVAKTIQNDLDEALTFYSKAVELDPGNAKAKQDMRKILYDLEREGKFAKAVEYSQFLIKRDPADVQLRLNLARLLVRTDKFDESVQLYLEVIKTDPANRDAYFNLGLVNAVRGKRDDAIACFKKVLELHPDDAAARQALDGVGATQSAPLPNPSH